MQCGATTRNGTPCKTRAMSNGRCRMHGGQARSGIASGTFKDGRYSKYIPSRLAARYQDAADDPTLLQLGHDVALVDARLADLLGRVDSGESGSLWRAVQQAFTQYSLVKGGKDDAKGFAALESAIEAGTNDYAAWSEISSLLEQRRKLVESERKRLIEMQNTLTVTQVMNLMGALAGIVKRHVSDPAILTHIQTELIQLSGQQAGSIIDAEPSS